jgi:NAD(P)-dependent dehydrogenase (short-subunit alcohol dehydrogenase family)
MPDLTDRRAVVTGANSGIGFEATVELARRGAHVVMACRSRSRAEEARAALKERVDGAPTVDIMELDLADLSSVAAFAEAYADRFDTLDLLINNAGIMAIPRRETADGFEMQMGVNHFGHFALTGRLVDVLEATPGARVVTVSSGAHRFGSIRFHDIHWTKTYSKWGAYGQSKLANLLFTFELQRRLEAADAAPIAVACHPGYAATNLQMRGPEMEDSGLLKTINRWANRYIAQSPAQGAWPTLYAATADAVSGGDYIGPDGWLEASGHPTHVSTSDAARDVAVARRLWAVSEDATGVAYDLSAPTPA